MFTIGLYGLAVLLLVGGGLVLFHGFGNRSLASESKTWPTAPGVIVTSTVVEEFSRKSSAWELRVTYSYTVAGTSYTGDVVRSGDLDYSDREGAEAKLAAYPVGATVAVRYDPDSPGRAVLESGGGEWWAIAGAGFVAGIAGIALLVFLVRDRAQRRAHKRKRAMTEAPPASH